MADIGFSTVCVVFVLSFVCVHGFFPNRFMNFSSSDFTHQDITETGILQAVAQFFAETSTQDRFVPAGIENITASKVFDSYYDGTASEKLFQEAIDDIVRANNKVDQDHYGESKWHVNGEAIKPANDMMTSLRERVIDELNSTSPNHDAARELIGQFLHIIQMFYSNSNWPELMGDAVYNDLGIRGKPLMAQATSSEDVCKSCGTSGDESCRDNLIIRGKLLTSGYKSGQDRIKPNSDPSQHQTGKCSHGGLNDLSSRRSAAAGGINKDTSDPNWSPHFHLHRHAAEAAIRHTKHFFDHPVYGLRVLLGDEVFQGLFGLKLVNSMVFVIDTSVYEEQFLAASRIQAIIDHTHGANHRPHNYIVITITADGPGCLHKMETFESRSIPELKNYINRLKIHVERNCSGFTLSAFEAVVKKVKPNSQIHVFTSSSPSKHDKVNVMDLMNVVDLMKERWISINIHLTGDQRNSDKRKAVYSRRRRSAGLDLYGGLAAASGGSVYHTDKGGVGKIADIIKESATTSATTLMKMSVATLKKVVDIPVDDTIREITIKIIADTAAKGEPSNTLTDPTNSTIPMTSKGNVSIKDLGGGLRLIKIKSPKPGVWQLTKTDSYSWDVEVTGQSTIDFTTKFVQTNPLNGFQYEITGRPIAGEKATVIITVPAIDKIGGITQVVLIDSTGKQLASAPLNHGRGRAASIFKGTFTLPKKSFQVTIQGTDMTGHKLQRLEPTTISTIAVKLSIGTLSGTLYVNENLDIPFIVTNTGDRRTTIEVDITDDLGFAVKATHKSFTLEGGANSTGTFTLHAGSKEGVTTTVTVSAQPAGVAGHSPQFETRRITVEQHITRKVDNTTPECNVTSVTGSCSARQMDPCDCHKHTWSGVAKFGDVDSGLFQVSSTLDDPNNLSYDNFTMGHTMDKGVKAATVKSDCCHPVTYINIVDLESNTGQCKFDLAPGLTRPVDLCTTTTPQLPTTTTAIKTTPLALVRGSEGLSTGAIAGIAVGGLLGLTAVVTAAVVIGKMFLCKSTVTEFKSSKPPASSKMP